MLPDRRAHGVLPVRDPQGAHSFYEDVLGLTPVAMPGIRTEDGVASLDGHLGAWSKDPEGNLIGLFQFAPGT